MSQLSRWGGVAGFSIGALLIFPATASRIGRCSYAALTDDFGNVMCAGRETGKKQDISVYFRAEKKWIDFHGCTFYTGIRDGAQFYADGCREYPNRIQIEKPSHANKRKASLIQFGTEVLGATDLKLVRKFDPHAVAPPAPPRTQCMEGAVSCEPGKPVFSNNHFTCRTRVDDNHIVVTRLLTEPKNSVIDYGTYEKGQTQSSGSIFGENYNRVPTPTQNQAPTLPYQLTFQDDVGDSDTITQKIKAAFRKNPLLNADIGKAEFWKNHLNGFDSDPWGKILQGQKIRIVNKVFESDQKTQKTNIYSGVLEKIELAEYGSGARIKLVGQEPLWIDTFQGALQAGDLKIVPTDMSLFRTTAKLKYPEQFLDDPDDYCVRPVVQPTAWLASQIILAEKRIGSPHSGIPPTHGSASKPVK